ncbi:MAG: acyl-CoA dehydrogenase family protein [Saprospiraceae bacterium]
MDFSIAPSLLAYRKAVTEFAEQELDFDPIETDETSTFPRAAWQKCADFGIQGLSVAKKYGGKHEQPDIIEAVLAMEGFGYGCKDGGLALALNAQMWTVQMPLAHFGTDAQREKYLPALTSGKSIAAHALTEPDAGSDVYQLQMTAEKVDGGYLLNGAKCYITLAPIADLILLFASTNPKAGKWGVTAFLVEKGTLGLHQKTMQTKMGLRSVPIGELALENCLIPEENRLGKEGAGFSIMNHSLEYDRCCILASQLGTMERQLEETITYVKKRKQFGQSIGKFQSVSNRIADMKLRLETARLLLYKVAWLKQNGKSAMLEAAMLKLHLGESFVASSLDAIRSHGAKGYLTEYGVERHLRDAVGGILYAGTSDIQRNIIARLMGI